MVSLGVLCGAEVLDGRNAQLDDGVQRALSPRPRDFADYARRDGRDRDLGCPARCSSRALVSALGCALAAGILLAFSTFVMRALGRLSAQHLRGMTPPDHHY